MRRGAARETWTPQPNFAARRDQLLLAMDIRDARMPQCRTLPITRLRRLIAQSYRNPGLSLADVARQAGMAQERFSIVFQQEMGRTFIDHLSRLRIGAAARRLACTRQRISTISRSVGYNDVDYFAAVFVRIMGVDPKEYRRQNARV